MPNPKDIITHLEESRLETTTGQIQVSRIETFVLKVPIQIPVPTSFGVMTERPALLVRIEGKDGAFGWGEIWCNFPACVAEHRAQLIIGELSELVINTILIDQARYSIN